MENTTRSLKKTQTCQKYLGNSHFQAHILLIIPLRTPPVNLPLDSLRCLLFISSATLSKMNISAKYFEKLCSITAKGRDFSALYSRLMRKKKPQYALSFENQSIISSEDMTTLLTFLTQRFFAFNSSPVKWAQCSSPSLLSM